jgi:hypothetical protein
MTSRTRWWFLGILLLGLGLRCITLEARSIAYDDAFSIFLAGQDLPAIVSGTAADTMPPLYYFLLHGWIQLGGSGLGWLRLLSVFLNLATLVALYGVTRALAGETAGLWALFLGAISPLQMYHAQDLRMYALLALGQVSYCWFFIRIWQGKSNGLWRWGNWAGLILSGAVAMYSHNLAIFVLAVPNFFLLARREWRHLGQLLLGQIGIGVLALPWLLLIPGQVAKIQHAFWTPQPGILEVIQSIILYTTHLPLPDGLLAAGLAISLVVLVLIAVETWRLWRERAFPSFLFELAFLPPALLLIASYLMRPVFVTRGFLAAALGYLGLAGVIVAQRWRQRPVGPLVAGLIAAGFVAGAGIGLPAHYTFDVFPRSPFQAAMVYLRERVQSGDQIVHDNKLSYFPSHYYAPDLPQAFLADPPGSANDNLALASQEAFHIYPISTIEQASQGARRVFYVVFEVTLEEYKNAGFAEHPQLAQLKTAFRQTGEVRFNDLVVYEFSR